MYSYMIRVQYFGDYVLRVEVKGQYFHSLSSKNLRQG